MSKDRKEFPSQAFAVRGSENFTRRREKTPQPTLNTQGSLTAPDDSPPAIYINRVQIMAILFSFVKRKSKALYDMRGELP
jgi:hypothetical protein